MSEFLDILIVGLAVLFNLAAIIVVCAVSLAIIAKRVN
jgi:hypothetical protein